MQHTRKGPDDGPLAGLGERRAVFNLLLLFLMAGLALFAAYCSGRQVELRERAGLRISGTVVRNEPSSDGDTYAAVVRFTDAAGKTVEFRDDISNAWPLLEVGRIVPVLYLQEAPKQSAIIDRRWENWFWPGVFLSGGLALLLWAFKLWSDWQGGDGLPNQRHGHRSKSSPEGG